MFLGACCFVEYNIVANKHTHCLLLTLHMSAAKIISLFLVCSSQKYVALAFFVIYDLLDFGTLAIVEHHRISIPKRKISNLHL